MNVEDIRGELEEEVTRHVNSIGQVLEIDDVDNVVDRILNNKELELLLNRLVEHESERELKRKGDL